MMPEICVVHLIRESNGIEPFQRFLESYSKNRGGIEHDLVIIFKGFSRKRGNTAYEELLKDFPHQSLSVRDYGFDIRAYFAATKRFNYKYYCFLNSFSVLLDENWLFKLYRYISQREVGLVGVAGSYESICTNSLRRHGNDTRFPVRVLYAVWLRLLRLFFDPFPNYHIRTNGFMISRDILRRIRYGIMLTKMHVHRFESGKRSLTKQVLDMNLNVFVVGKDGKGYEKKDWYSSETFRQREQGNLLIADNQTIAYSLSEPELRKKLSLFAWGNQAFFK